MLEGIYIKCETVAWLNQKANKALSKLNMIDFKLYITRLEKELDGLYSDLLDLINSPLFDILHDNVREEMWLLFGEIGRELDFP